jgi:hypothetical protein
VLTNVSAIVGQGELAVGKSSPAVDLAPPGGKCLRTMTVHLIKLCVGCDSIEDLAEWIEFRLQEARKARRKPEHVHTTRMMPTRKEELLEGGSLYWVIKGVVQVRQRLIGIRPFTDEEGIRRCRLVLEPKTVPTEWQPKRPFQGWRYYDPKDVPVDLKPGRRADELPPALRAELAELGLR